MLTMYDRKFSVMLYKNRVFCDLSLLLDRMDCLIGFEVSEDFRRPVVILILNHALIVKMALNVLKRRTRLENLLIG